MYNRLLEKMVTLKTALSTERTDYDTVDEDDTRGRVLLVEAGGSAHAIRVTAVREVLRARGITRVPGAPRFMLGLVNVRGMVVTVLDLQECLSGAHARETNNAAGVTGARAKTDQSIVLLEHGNRVVGVSVDVVRDVRVLDDDEPAVDARAHGAEHAPDREPGIVSAGGGFVMLLDVATLLARHLFSSAET